MQKIRYNLDTFLYYTLYYHHILRSWVIECLPFHILTFLFYFLHQYANTYFYLYFKSLKYVIIHKINIFSNK